MAIIRHPDEFVRMPRKACGPNSARFVVNALDKKYKEDDGLDGKPVFPERMASLLRANGVEDVFVRRYTTESDEGKFRALKGYLEQGYPVPILTVVNFLPHWVVVCGWDEDLETFYVYDPDPGLPDHDTTLLTGNSCYTPEELLRVWGMKWWGVVRSWRNLLVGPTPR